MPESANELFTFILTQCQASAPQPWYPSSYSGAGVAREDLDKALDDLRLNNLIRLTDWVQGRGQGYRLTAGGEEVMRTPRLLKRLGEGAIPNPAATQEIVERDNELHTPWQRGEAVRAVLTDPVRPVASRLILWLNLGIFAWGIGLVLQRGLPLNMYLDSTRAFAGQVNANKIRDLEGISNILAETGAISPYHVVIERQWWRFLTYAFVHIGVIHLIMNMTCLYTMGGVLETMWGRGGYLILYFVSALGGGIAITLAGTPAAGASGALSGLLVSTAVWLSLNFQHMPRDWALSVGRNVIFNLVLLFLISMLPGISWQGHLGGAIAGAVVSAPLVFCRYSSGPQRRLGVAGVALVILLVAAVAAGLTTGHLSIL